MVVAGQEYAWLAIVTNNQPYQYWYAYSLFEFGLVSLFK